MVSFLISLSIIFSIPNAISPTYTGANLTEAPAKGITEINLLIWQMYL